MAEHDEDEDDEVEEEDEVKSSPRKAAFVSRSHSGNSKLMSIVAKLKKVKPVYWVLGLGSAALAVDYLVEGDRSIVMSLYHGIFGGHGGGGSGGGSHARTSPGMAMMPSGSSVALPSPVYYPAYPVSYYAWNGYPFGNRHSHFGHAFGHGYGGHSDHHGAWREFGHRGIR